MSGIFPPWVVEATAKAFDRAMQEDGHMTLTEFLLARIAEEEREVVDWPIDGGWGLHSPGVMWTDPHGHPIYAPRARVLAECEAKRRIVELHKNWPVLVQSTPVFERVESSDPDSVAVRASQQIMWQTEQEYRERFGTEPPTAPMIRALASIYADHPDYREEWKP